MFGSEIALDGKECREWGNCHSVIFSVMTASIHFACFANRKDVTP